MTEKMIKYAGVAAFAWGLMEAIVASEFYDTELKEDAKQKTTCGIVLMTAAFAIKKIGEKFVDGTGKQIE